MSRKQQPMMLHKGLELQGWILDKRIDQAHGREQWLAHRKNSQQQKIISCAAPQSGSEYDVDIAVTELYYPGQEIDGWILQQRIASGSTAEVWSATSRKMDVPAALKICVTQDPDQITFFEFEQRVLQHCADVDGVIPLLDYSLKQNSTTAHPSWVALPVVTPVMLSFDMNTTLTQLVSVIVNVTEIIQNLIDYDVLYKEIKLDHICWYENHVVLVDFSTVIYPASKYSSSHYVERSFPAHAARELATILRQMQEALELTHPALDDIIDSYCMTAKNNGDALTDFMSDLVDWHAEQSLSCKSAHPTLLQQALHHYENHDYELAEDCCQQLLQCDANQDEAYHLMGVISMLKEHYSDAIDYLSQALELDSQHPEYFNSMGKWYESQEKIITALRYYQYALTLKPDYEVAYFNRMMAMVKKNEKVKARQSKRMARRAQLGLRKAEEALSARQRRILLRPFEEEVQVITEQGKRILVKTSSQSESDSSEFEAVSWGQFFYDLSFGSYRTCYNYDRRPFRSRSWHFLLKNLPIVDRIVRSTAERVSILDLGCATGYFRRFLEGNLPEEATERVFYWGVDPRADLLHRAVHHTTDTESSACSNITPAVFLWHDVQRGLPFSPDQFDHLVCFEFMKYFTLEKSGKLLQEMWRVLKPDATLYLSITHESKRKDVIAGLDIDGVSKLLRVNGFELERVVGGQVMWQMLKKHIRTEHKAMVEQMASYLPEEMLAAVLAPLYPEVSTQRVYYCRRNGMVSR